jgi:hypothetical protein
MSEQHEKLDAILDRALAEYGHAEPRLGLEARVLARLDDEEQSSARAGWWKWSWVPAAAALLIVGGLYLSRPRAPEAPKVAEQPAPPVTTAATKPQPPAVTAAPRTRPHMRPALHSAPQLAEAPARQPRFPAPVPLTEQDRLLLAYVRSQPQAAAQQAKAAAEPLAEMKIPPLEIPPLNPDGNQQAPER